LVGEKHVPLDKFGVGWWDNSLYNGEYLPSHSRGAGPAYPLAKSMSDPGWLFGSYHPAICQFTFGDGGVRSLSVDIDPNILGLLSCRNDGQPIPDY
jgi:hypothetical protein